ncbi:MAG: glycosyltransferase [Chloroflexota bacterium]
MRVLMVSKACLTGTYQSKLTAIGQHAEVDLAVMVPPFWEDPAGRVELERQYTDGYEFWVEPLRFNGNYHLHHWPTLRARAAEFKPDIIHMDEEPYNFATWLALRAAKRAGAKFLFFSWQNIFRKYPPPFRWMEQQVLQQADFGIMGNRDAADVFLRKGFAAPHAIIPQFGIDAEVFKRRELKVEGREEGEVKRIGFAGRLIWGKGVDLLLDAVALLTKTTAWEILIAGEGPEENSLKTQAQTLGIAERVKFVGRKTSAEMPAFLQSLDALVLPSRTLPTWKEQFGRILVEAMACGVSVIGSGSGEIPHVIGDAGAVFKEGDATDLAQKLEQVLAADQEELAQVGRERVLTHFTQHKIAAETIKVYEQLVR